MRCLATNPHARPAADEIEGQLGGMIAALAAGTLPEAIPFPIFAEAAGSLKGGSSPLKGGPSPRQNWLPPIPAVGGLREAVAHSDSAPSVHHGSSDEGSVS